MSDWNDPDAGLPQSAAEAETKYNIPTGIIQGLEKGEGSKDFSVSPKGAKGRMQFMPDEWGKYGLGRPITSGPANYDAAARYMLDLHGQYGDWRAAQAHYNGGTAAAKAVLAGKEPPAAETRKYLKITSKAAPWTDPDKDGDFVEPPAAIATDKKALPTVGQTAQASADDKAGAAKAAVKAMGEGILPAAAGFAAFSAGASAGALAGVPVAALTGPLAPVTEAVFTIGGGLAAALGASYSVAQMQNWALAHAPQSLLAQFGMDRATREKEERDHPYASMAGSVAANLPFARPGMVSFKQMGTMMGLGAALEAGKEYATGEPLDPIKLSIAAAGGAASAKTTKLGAKLSGIGADVPTPKTAAKPRTTEEMVAQAKQTVMAEQVPTVAAREAKAAKVDITAKENPLLSKDLYPNLASLAPRREYVGQVQDALGPGWSEDALRYWNTIASKFGQRGPMPTGAPIQGAVDWLSDRLYTLNQMRQGDKLQIRKFMEGLDPQDMLAARSEAMYHTMTDEVQAGVPRTPEMERIYRDTIAPLDKQIDRLYNQIKANSPQDVADFNPHNPRILKDTFLTKVARWGEDIFGTQGFGRRAGSLNERTMLALEYEDGTRRVVNRDGLSFTGYGPQRSKVSGLNTKQGSVARTPDRIEVGDSLVDDAGRKAKLVQASTAEIEAQTGLQYSKDALANKLITLSQLRAYAREHEFLTNTMEGMKNAGAAISRQKVPTAPHGFVEVPNHPTLEKYYIQERFAEAFKDALQRDRISLPERLNNMAVGSMFWNPEPHLFNALDHYVNSIGWDWLKPWQYKSIIQDMYTSYKDVSTLSPDYIKYVNSGMGLQYARVAGEDVTKTIMKGIGKRSWDELAVAWGMHPEKMIGAIYDGAKKVLWGGSDVMMLAAYRHAASEKGVDILNQAVKNFVEAHNPNYRIPTRIGFDTMMQIPGMPETVAKALGRGFSLGMQTRLFNTFGRYHFGQMKAIGQSLHDVVAQTPRSAQTRMNAAGHLAFMAFNLGVVYPFLWDNMAKALSGNQDAYMRRSGAATIPYTIYHLLLGDQEFTRLLAEAYNLPPITKALIEVPSNRQLFNGQHIWEPGDTFASQWEDTRNYVTGLLVSPVKTGKEFAKGELPLREQITKQFGIKTKPDTLSDEYLEKAAERARRHRAKKGYDE